MRGTEGPMGLTGLPGPEGPRGFDGQKGEQGEFGEQVRNHNPSSCYAVIKIVSRVLKAHEAIQVLLDVKEAEGVQDRMETEG